MQRSFIHLAFILFIITAISGVWMRAVPFMANSWIEYDHILHGHSHIAMLGWTFLGLFIVFLALLWPNLKQKKQAIALTFTLFIVSVIMFFAFLYQGYGLYSIILSTIHIFVEYWAAYFIYKQLKAQDKLPKATLLFIKGSLIALIISSFGPYALGYTAANDLRESPLFDMSVYFFLHFQYNGWLYLFAFGLFTMILYKKNIAFSKTLGKYSFCVYFISLFPWYVSSILWADLGNFSRVIATVGSIGQFIGVILALLLVKSAWTQVKQSYPKLTTFSLLITFILLFAKSAMEIGLISPSLANLVFDTRNVIIGYLHLTLLGFVSIFIITQFQMTGLIKTKTNLPLASITIFLIGFILNEAILFLTGLASWTTSFTVPYPTQTLLIASIILTIGVTSLWMSSNKFKETI